MEIRRPHIRKEVLGEIARLDDERHAAGHDSLSKSERQAVASGVLRRYLVDGLGEPQVELNGVTLPEAGQTISAGPPATRLPDDTPAGVVEALVRDYTDEPDSVCLLFGRSRTGVRVAELLGRRPVLVDPYADCIQEERSAARSPIFRQAWDPGAVLELLCEQHPGFPLFSMLLVHLPATGVMDREKFLYPETEAPARPVHWESLGRERFFTAFEQRIRQWGPTVADSGKMAILSTPSRFADAGGKKPGSESPVFPFVQTEMEGLGWQLERRHSVDRPPNDSPIGHPALRRMTLGVYTREGSR